MVMTNVAEDITIDALVATIKRRNDEIDELKASIAEKHACIERSRLYTKDTRLILLDDARREMIKTMTAIHTQLIDNENETIEIEEKLWQNSYGHK